MYIIMLTPNYIKKNTDYGSIERKVVKLNIGVNKLSWTDG
jgi:hypothetical protein